MAVKSRCPSATPKSKARGRTRGPASSAEAQAREMLCTLIDYENAARKNGLDLTDSRFRKLTAAERELLRAELVAEYIRVSVAGSSGKPEPYGQILTAFCEKICDLGVPSHELLGTYLAALDVVATDRRFARIDWLSEAVRYTMPAALRQCVEIIREKSEATTPARAI